MYTNHRVFDWFGHKQFADISCDYNPIHIDAVSARRTHAGAPIIHGIHSLIWILDCLPEAGFSVTSANSLRAQFLHPIYVGDKVNLEISSSAPNTVRARATVGTEEVVVVLLSVSDAPKTQLATGAKLCSIIPPDSPNDINLQQMDGMSGRLSFGPMISRIATLFPSAIACFGLGRVEALVSSSCLVGMVVPGLHSMFIGLELSLTEHGTPLHEAVEFMVLSVVPRFRLVRIGFKGPGLHGILETVNRLPPCKQTSMGDLIPRVSSAEFSGTTALVIGGSRGLGELTAKLIAAGGGDVVITYMVGKSDADAVVDEINSSGPRCRAISYDVHRPVGDQLMALSVPPTHIYYFATPRIYRRKSGILDFERYFEFNVFYVTAFFALVQNCVRLRPDGIRVFFPSTTFIDTRPAELTEYAMSKAAAEVLCCDIPRLCPGAQVLTRRLPRLPTDQTISTVQGKRVDATEVLLPILREMRRESV